MGELTAKKDQSLSGWHIRFLVPFWSEPEPEPDIRFIPINNTNNDIFTVFALHINHRTPVSPHITFLVVYSATGITKRATRQTWRDCFFGFVRLAIQSLAYFFIPAFSSPTFSSSAFATPALFQRSLSTQHCIYMSLHKLGNKQLTHYDGWCTRTSSSPVCFDVDTRRTTDTSSMHHWWSCVSGYCVACLEFSSNFGQGNPVTACVPPETEDSTVCHLFSGRLTLI